MPLAFSRLVKTPVVTTIHGFSSERILPAFKAYEDSVHYVAISDADRHPDLRYAATIHHGIRLEDFPFDPHGSEDLLFFGRIHPDKGAAEAIAAAGRTGRRLIMAAGSTTCSTSCMTRRRCMWRIAGSRATGARTRPAWTA